MEQIQDVGYNPHPIFEHLEERSPCTFDAIISILCYAASCEMLEDGIHSLSDTHPTISGLTSHLSYNINKQVVQHRNADDVAVDQSRLSNVLDSYKLEAIDVPKDGDCILRPLQGILLSKFTVTTSLLILCSTTCKALE